VRQGAASTRKLGENVHGVPRVFVHAASAQVHLRRGIVSSITTPSRLCAGCRKALARSTYETPWMLTISLGTRCQQKGDQASLDLDEGGMRATGSAPIWYFRPTLQKAGFRSNRKGGVQKCKLALRQRSRIDGVRLPHGFEPSA